MSKTAKFIAPRRVTTGAHYGTRDWLAQRLTALLMLAYFVVLIVSYSLSSAHGYEAWAGLFAQNWFKLFSVAVFVGLAYHAWIGVRDIWMDYVKPLKLRILLHLFSIAWLIACLVWVIQILWRV